MNDRDFGDNLIKSNDDYFGENVPFVVSPEYRNHYYRQVLNIIFEQFRDSNLTKEDCIAQQAVILASLGAKFYKETSWIGPYIQHIGTLELELDESKELMDKIIGSIHALDPTNGGLLNQIVKSMGYQSVDDLNEVINEPEVYRKLIKIFIDLRREQLQPMEERILLPAILDSINKHPILDFLDHDTGSDLGGSIAKAAVITAGLAIGVYVVYKYVYPYAYSYLYPSQDDELDHIDKDFDVEDEEEINEIISNDDILSFFIEHFFKS